MATINAPTMERRHIPERRSSITHPASMNVADWAATVLMIIGGINWGLVGVLDYNLVSAMFGEQTPISRFVYVLIGLAALYGIYTASKLSSRRSFA